MSHTYLPRRREENAAPAQEPLQTAVPGPSLRELAAGAAPSREQMGHRVDLPEAIRAKMEASFGADFSNVKLYESRTVADAGADAMAMGGAIGFAPGKLDLGSTAGQAMLGHELSHVVSQARGEVRGAGFLNDASLEARADREGALAAAGESVYAGPVTPLSASAVPAATGGVMQAVGKSDKEKIQLERNQARQQAGSANSGNLITALPESGFFRRRSLRKQLRDQYDAEEAAKLREGTPSPERVGKEGPLQKLPDDDLTKSAASRNPVWEHFLATRNGTGIPEQFKDLEAELFQKFDSVDPVYKLDYDISNANVVSDPAKQMTLKGLNIRRSVNSVLKMAANQGKSEEEIKKLYDGLIAPHHPRAKNAPKATKERLAAEMDSSLWQMKKMYYTELKRMQSKYGTTITQMHPEDFIRQATAKNWDDKDILQDCLQMMESGSKFFDMDSKEDQEFRDLTNYFVPADAAIVGYTSIGLAGFRPEDKVDPARFGPYQYALQQAKALEDKVVPPGGSGPRMGEQELAVYREDVRNRFRGTGKELGF